MSYLPDEVGKQIEGNGRPAAPGWYQDPSDPRQRRWWNGTVWTYETTGETGYNRSGGGLATTGYITGLVIPIVGFIIGLVLLAQSKIGPGLAVIGTSFVGGLLAIMLLA